MFAPDKVPPSLRRRFPAAATLRPTQLEATLADAPLIEISAARLRRRYVRLAMPVLIVAGTADRIVATELQSQRLHRCVKGSQENYVAGAGHMIHHTDPDEVAAAIAGLAETAGLAATDAPGGSSAPMG